MDIHTIECWNCGQSLTISVTKLATARCGNCQQKVVMEEDAQETESQPISNVQYQPIVKQRSGVLSWIGSFLLNLTVTLVMIAGVLYFIFYILKTFDLPYIAFFCLVGVPIIRATFKLLSSIVKQTNSERD